MPVSGATAEHAICSSDQGRSMLLAQIDSHYFMVIKIGVYCQFISLTWFGVLVWCVARVTGEIMTQPLRQPLSQQSRL